MVLSKQDQMLQVGKETKEETIGPQSDTWKHLDDDFAEVRSDLVSIKDAFGRASIHV